MEKFDQEIDQLVRKYKDRIRIFMILYVFGDTHYDAEHPERKLVFETETKLQKIDFLLRYPDYLAYELLGLVQQGVADRGEVRGIVCDMINAREPELRRNDMKRFFYGAYEDIDDVIAFLHSIGFVVFESKRDAGLRVVEKSYFVTETAIKKTEKTIDSLPFIKWYETRCELIKRFFGMKTAADLKKMQYSLDEIAKAPIKELIAGMSGRLHNRFAELYGEEEC
jgi:hypothetical protein